MNCCRLSGVPVETNIDLAERVLLVSIITVNSPLLVEGKSNCT